jgi:uncharacterized membrane protein
VRASLRTYFLAGLLTLTPLVVTLWILSWIFNWLDGLLGPYIYERLGHPVPGLGLVATVLLVFLIGLVTTNIVGRQLMRTLDGALHRIPVVRSIYSTAKQMSDSLLRGRQVAFQKVVLIEYPRRGLFQLGFITGKIEGPLQQQLAEKTGERVVNVFVPATPNPMSGYLVMLPERDIHVLSLSVQDGLKLVISGGMVTPAALREALPGRAGSRAPAAEPGTEEVVPARAPAPEPGEAAAGAGGGAA